MDPLAVILVASFSALLSLGVGGLAIRAILNNKLITIASHNEHVTQWKDQVEGLRKRLTEQEAAHQAEQDRAEVVADKRVENAKLAGAERIADRDKQLLDAAAERARLLRALDLADESWREVTSAQRHGTDSALRLAVNMIRANPLLDEAHPGLPQVVEHDRSADSAGGGGAPGD